MFVARCTVHTLVLALSYAVYEAISIQRVLDANGAESGTGTVNFLFLLKDGLPHLPIWEEFFAGADGSTSALWAHCENYSACANDTGLNKLGMQLVPTVPSERCVDLVSPEVQLMRHALRRPGSFDIGRDKFVLLSDTTLPLKPLSTVLGALLATTTTDFCFFPLKDWPDASIDGHHMFLAKTAQWAVFNEEHARTLVQTWLPCHEIFGWNMPYAGNSVSTQAFNRPLTGSDRRCSDEVAVFASIFGPMSQSDVGQGFERFGVSSACHTLTLFQWPSRKIFVPDGLQQIIDDDPDTHTDGGLPDAAKGDLLTGLKDVLEGLKNGIEGHPTTFLRLGNRTLQALRHSSFLFARKFERGFSFPGFSEVMFGPEDD
eukprot:TRINITY_DN57941_c0_g1_i1.p1 TRINITY_DN57941_c0_g1~~TRINITY_DN57941_c0_g1_i1.p1  ORF type:complete len:373 (+),score=50.94 TRINITY_DN57941_c0_g1_i1:78-1196(+)